MLADHQRLDRMAMAGLLSAVADFEVVGQAGTVVDVVHACRRHRPDVLVMTLNLPDQESVPAVIAVRRALSEVPILALSERGTEDCLVLNPPSRRPRAGALPLAHRHGPDCLQLALVQGAAGTLRRDASPRDLYRAIRDVASGKRREPVAAPADRPVARLSPREREVASLVAEGRSNKEIANELSITETTVKKHVGQVLMKLHAEDRLQLGLLLARNPLLLSPSRD